MAEHDGAEAPQKKKRRNRSPGYPAFGLGEAIERVTELYKSVWNNAVGVDAACEVWDLSFSSSTGKRTLSALTQFGLLENEGKVDARMVKLSQRALSVVEDPDGVTEAHDVAIKEAALTPATYQKTWERWGPRFPADDRITPWLVQQLGFNPNSTAQFLEAFRATIRFVGLDNLEQTNEIDHSDDAGDKRQPDSDQRNVQKGGSGGQKPLADESRAKARAPMTDTTIVEHARPKPEIHDFSIPLRGAGVAVLSVSVPLSDHNFTQLEEWLKWAKDSLVYHSEDDE